MKAHAYCLLPFIAIFLVSACSEKSETEFPSNTETLTAIPISELGEVGERVKQLGSGAPTDLDGDGIPEAQLTRDQSGVVHFETVNLQGNVNRYQVFNPDGSSTTLIDYNNDGQTDAQIEDFVNKKGERSKIVYLNDLNFDGYPEERRTDVYDWDNRLRTVTEERDDEGNGNYIIIKQWTRKLWKEEDFKKKRRGDAQNPVVSVSSDDKR